MTLDLYGHLFADRLDTIADAMDAARQAALADRREAAGSLGILGSTTSTGASQSPVQTIATGPRRASNVAQNVLTRRKLCWIC